MTVYILIAALYGSHGLTMTTQEFNSLKTCKDAAKVVEDKFDGTFLQVRTECVLK